MLQEDCFGRKSNANRIIEAGFSRLELASKAEIGKQRISRIRYFKLDLFKQILLNEAV